MRFWREDKAVTAIEYGLIAALIAVAAIVALMQLGGSMSSNFDEVSSAVDGGKGGGGKGGGNKAHCVEAVP